MSEALACQECGTAVPGDAPEGLCPSCLLKQGLGKVEEAAPRNDSPSTSGYGGAFVAPEPAELAPYFPHLEIMALLGQGGMGAVYKARQLKLDRLVALKILPLGQAKDAGFTERFTREARALARLNHPHIVGVHDFGETGGWYYFVMEYVDGANLRQLIWSRQLQPQDSLKIIPQICDALQYAHDEGIVHRDIKPENILLDKKGRVKIADFGLAKLVGGAPAQFTLTGSRQMMGTPHYMAPEQMERPLNVDHRADIFSLGVVFYEMLTSELPLGRFAPPSRKVQTDARLDEVVLRALTKEPELRYQRVSEIKNEVEAIAGVGRPVAAAVKVADASALEWDLEMVRLRVQGPAGGLLVTAVLAGLTWGLIGIGNHGALNSATVAFAIMVFLIPLVILVAGSLTMAKLRRYELAMAAAILAVVPWYPAWPVGVFIGGWVLDLLAKPEVRAAFAVSANPFSKSFQDWVNIQRRGLTGSTEQPKSPDSGPKVEQPVTPSEQASAPGPVVRKLHSLMRSVRYYCFDSLRGRASVPVAGGAAVKLENQSGTQPPKT
jgi:hypothetical protein